MNDLSRGHTTSLLVDGDLDTLRAESKVPVLFNTCEIDEQFDAARQALADTLLGDGKYKAGYRRTYFAGVRHGFAVRGDLVSPMTPARDC